MTDRPHNSESNTSDLNLVSLPNELRFAEWSDLIRWGIERCGSQNKYFCQVALPGGWSVRPGETPDWRELVDDNGRVRADIYSCYNQVSARAFVALRRRFTTTYEFSPDGKSLRVAVMDGNERMHCTRWMPCDVGSIDEIAETGFALGEFLNLGAQSGAEPESLLNNEHIFKTDSPLPNGRALRVVHDWQTHRALEEEAKTWLRRNLSNWQNPLAYWDFVC